MRINTIYGMILIFLYFALAKLGGILWKIDPFWSVFSFIAAVACLIIGIPGFKRIKPNELGAVLLWGKPAYSVDSGIVITPFPYKLARVSKNIIELRFPDDKTQGKKSTPIQITHGTSKDASSGALGYIQKTPVSIIVRCKIIDLLEYVQEFGGYDYNDNVSTTELINRIREAVVSKMIDECRKGTLAENLKRLNEMEEKLKLEVESITKNHGVEIITTRIEDIDLGDMNKAYREAALSEIKKEKVVHEADAEMQKRIIEGIGASEALKILKFGQAEGYKELAKKLGIEDAAALYKVDALVKAIESNRNTDISLIGENVGEALKILTVLKNVEEK